jgi:endonuclease III
MNYKWIFKTLEQDHQPTMLEQLKDHSPFQLLIATLLSARTKDSTVIPIVKELFKKYKTPVDFFNIEIKNLEKLIFKIGFYRVKSKNIQNLSKILIEKYNNEVPSTLDKLVSLPGVGRKTANCVLTYVYDKPAIAVDIHVHRISNRLGWVKTKNELETEKELMKLLPKKDWKKVNKLFVDHGQRICLPRKPQCCKCRIKQYCKSYNC